MSSPTATELAQFDHLVQLIVNITLHQCDVYKTSVPNSLVRKIEPTQQDKQNVLAYHVSKQLQQFIDPTAFGRGGALYRGEHETKTP